MIEYYYMVIKIFFLLVSFYAHRNNILASSLESLNCKKEFTELNSQLFLSEEIEKLNIQIKGSIPVKIQGPTVIVANHPNGLLDMLILLSFVLSKTNTVKIIASSNFENHKIIKDFLLPIDVFKNDSIKNDQTINEANSFLKKRGVIIVFPAGTIETGDTRWKTGTARFINKTDASVIPIYINSGKIYEQFTIISLMKAIAKFQNKTGPDYTFPMLEHAQDGKNEISLQINQKIPHEIISAFKTNQELMDFLKKQTLLLPPE